jgi:hypothetical protein
MGSEIFNAEMGGGAEFFGKVLGGPRQQRAGGWGWLTVFWRNEAEDVEVDCSGCGGVSVVGSEVFNAETRRFGDRAEFYARC